MVIMKVVNGFTKENKLYIEFNEMIRRRMGPKPFFHLGIGLHSKSVNHR